MNRRWVAATVLFTFALQPLGLRAAEPRSSEQFRHVKLMVNTGEKGEEAEVVLRLERDRLVVRSEAGTDLKAFPYEAITSAEYSYSKSPRWKSGTAAAIAVGVFAVPVFFMKGKKHWLTITSDGDFALLRLDKDNYRMILPALEARSGKAVDALAEQ